MTTESEHNENEAVAVSQDSTELRADWDAMIPVSLHVLGSFKTQRMPIQASKRAQILLQRAGGPAEGPDQEPEQAKDRQAGADGRVDAGLLNQILPL